MISCLNLNITNGFWFEKLSRFIANEFFPTSPFEPRITLVL